MLFAAITTAFKAYAANRVHMKAIKRAERDEDVESILNLIHPRIQHEDQEYVQTDMQLHPAVAHRAFAALWDLSAQDHIRMFMQENRDINRIWNVMQALGPTGKHNALMLFAGAGVICNLTIEIDILPSEILHTFVEMIDLSVEPILQIIDTANRVPRKYHSNFKINAPWILWSFAHIQEGIDIIVQHNGIGVIFESLQHNVPLNDSRVNTEILINTTGILWNLTEKTEVSNTVKDTYGFGLLVSLLETCHDDTVQCHLLQILMNMVCVLDCADDILAVISTVSGVLLQRPINDHDDSHQIVLSSALMLLHVMAQKSSIRKEYDIAVLESDTFRALITVIRSPGCFEASVLLLHDILVGNNAACRPCYWLRLRNRFKEVDGMKVVMMCCMPRTTPGGLLQGLGLLSITAADRREMEDVVMRIMNAWSYYRPRSFYTRPNYAIHLWCGEQVMLREQ